MKIKDSYVTQNIKDMQVMVDVSGDGFRGMVRSNKTAAFIVDQLRTETTREEILATMKQTYSGVSEEILAEDLDYVLAPLRAIVRLRRGETNSIERVDLLEGTRDFYAATCRFRDRDLMQRVLGLLARIVEQVPCYRLSCTMDPEAADTALAGLAEALEAERHEGQGCSPGELLNKRR